jgi:hypothetical protein
LRTKPKETFSLPGSKKYVWKRGNVQMDLAKKVVAEFIGTFWLVLGGCGSAVLAAGFMSGPPNNIHMGIGFLGSPSPLD